MTTGCVRSPEESVERPDRAEPTPKASFAATPRCRPLRLTTNSEGNNGSLLPFDPPPVNIERVVGLAEFYADLAELARGRRTEHVRIAVFGDSNLTLDYTSGYLRRSLQKRFGEGGHGFVALARPWSHYRHLDVRHDVISGWRAFAITTSPTGDGLYGLSGIAVENLWQGAKTFVQTAEAGAPVGTEADTFRIFSLGRKRGGDFTARVDDSEAVRIKTRATEPVLIETVLRAPLGEHRLEIASASPEAVRVFGVALERSEPGIVVDSFGVGSLNTKTMARADPELAKQMLRSRGYSLIVHLTGANDVFTMPAVPAALERILAIHKEALPHASVLLATPAARGLTKPFPQTEAVVKQRHELAREHNLPLWDQFAAMGGAGSMREFVKAKLAFGDAVHFTEQGGALMGERLAAALLNGFTDFLAAHPNAGCTDSR